MYSGANDDDTAFGLAANLAAAGGYVLPIIALVFLFVEDDNEFLRFNAAQSVAFAVSFTLGLMPTVIAALGSIILLVINLGIFAGIIFLACKAYSEETVELPVFADIARSIEGAL